MTDAGKALRREIDAVFEIAEKLLDQGRKAKTVRKALIEPVFRALERKLTNPEREEE
jgi:hypothetical protein